MGDELERLRYENKVMRDTLKKIAALREYMHKPPKEYPPEIQRMAAALGMAYSLSGKVLTDLISSDEEESSDG
jgi:hypothetical protein